MLPVEWDEGTQVVRSSVHRATRKVHTCISCDRTISIGQRYMEIIAWGLVAFVTEGIAGLFIGHKRELQRDVLCLECGGH